ncbi:hypothetical protein [Rubrivivax gelatinosus]|uniref:Uncharacterized protein n=1 Tax=Rubrivivax gelatinosus TaxID=28068 RepID=A0A4R2MJH5_RUBGE|nr:hypothetical protein [Rubrivivax gelatinosus]MBK1690329.1 hypothetical protein [Rubrivivax gelatinosus]TCP05485.1 hypothetical protein EV684_101357 [Rubrivivax gelatinosus]
MNLKPLHLAAGVLAPLCIASFFVATVAAELFGTPQTVATVKALIVTPGLWILLPAMAALGASGFALGRSRHGRLVDAKRRRMPIVAANGLLVLLPCAIVLARWAAAGRFDAGFYAVQALELAAGATNLALMFASLRDGLQLAGRRRPAVAAGAR